MATEESSAPQAQQEERRRPPKALFRYVLNPLMRTILRSPLHGRISKNLMLVTFTGRKSGKRFTTPVAYRREGKVIISFIDGPWWKNLTGGAPVMLRVAGRTQQAYARPTTDQQAVARYMQQFLQQNGLAGARQVGIFPAPKTMPSWDEFMHYAQGRALVTFQLS